MKIIDQDGQWYGSIAVARLTGISLRQLYYWVDGLHIVQPQVRQHGRRRFRHFTARDVRTINRMRELVETGYTLATARRMAGDEAEGTRHG